MNETADSKRASEHENVIAAKLDAAKFVIAQFGQSADKPAVYDAAIKYVENALR